MKIGGIEVQVSHHGAITFLDLSFPRDMNIHDDAFDLVVDAYPKLMLGRSRHDTLRQTAPFNSMRWAGYTSPMQINDELAAEIVQFILMMVPNR